jgi:hypothetical protein
MLLKQLIAKEDYLKRGRVISDLHIKEIEIE